mgnify:CR=1 FL=1
MEQLHSTSLILTTQGPRQHPQLHSIPWYPLMPQEEFSPEQLAVHRNRILEAMLLEEGAGLPSLRLYDKTKLRAEVRNVNEAANRVETHNIAFFNVCCCICHYRKNWNVEEEERKKDRSTKPPFWKRSVKLSIETWKKYLGWSRKSEEGTQDWNKNKGNDWKENNALTRMARRTSQKIMLKEKIKTGGITIMRYDWHMPTAQTKSTVSNLSETFLWNSGWKEMRRDKTTWPNWSNHLLEKELVGRGHYELASWIV